MLPQCVENHGNFPQWIELEVYNGAIGGGSAIQAQLGLLYHE